MVVSGLIKFLTSLANRFFFPEDRVVKQKLSLQEKLDKACAENAELRAKELALMERTTRLYVKCCTFFSHEFCFCKQLDVLSKKK